MENDQLAPSILIDENGNGIALRNLLGRHQVQLVFLRDLHSPASHLNAQEAWASRHTLRRAGKRLVFIGGDKPEAIAEFKRRTKMFEAVIFSDAG